VANVEVEAALALALELADRADAITMARFRAADLVVQTKPDLTPVSEADRAVEEMVRAHLATRAPDHDVLGEEFGGGEASGSWCWIVDPIDGTKNYVRGVPVWATLLGLEHDGEVVVGVVSAPALGSRWWAGRGLGAYRDGERIGVSAVGTLGDAQLSFAWDTTARFDLDGVGNRMMALGRECWRTRGLGDFWQHMLVADGSFDISIDPIVAYWDAAALLPIIEEAGGRWSTIDGGTDPRTADSLVCTNGRLHSEALRSLQR
jgi:histidinol-phosphatase